MHRLRPPARSVRPRWWALGAALLAAAVAFLPYLHWVSPALGCVFVLVMPATMLHAKVSFSGSSNAHRIVLSVALTVFLLMVGALTVNTILPPLGDDHPLARGPIVVSVLLLDLALIGWRRERTPAVRLQGLAVPRAIVLTWVLLTAALIACVLGANRLNNGLTGSVTLVGFGLLLIAVCMLWRTRRTATDGQIAAMLYAVALTLLLATSLRGWYITGHDIQREYYVFQLTHQQQHWQMSSLKNSYNACMSLTVLPDALAQTLRMDPAYIFKVMDQAFFALAPVALYLVSRTQFSRQSSILAVLLFVSFPTFFTDLPFITRQEVGFTFVAVALLVIVNRTWSHSARVLWFMVFGVAIVLSHYSTTYVLLISLVTAQLLRFVARLWARFRGRRVALAVTRHRPVAGPVVIFGLIALAVVWTGPLTHTSTQLSQTVRDTASTLFGDGQGEQSTDVGYSVVGGKVSTPSQELAQYREETLTFSTPSRLPASVVDRYPVKAIAQPNQPYTTVGNTLDKASLSPSMINSRMRALLADYYQVAAVFGLFLVAWRYRRRGSPHPGSSEYLLLGAASFVGLGAVLVLPDLSVEYGLLRAFQQALLFVAPLAAEATLFAVGLIARAWAPKITAAFMVVAMASLIGFLPQALGGYPAQLSLNNAGTYYNDYYLHSQEQDSIDWLLGHVGPGATDVQSEIQTDRYTVFLLDSSHAHASGDIFPTLIQRQAYVFVGYSTVTRGIASVSVDGNTVSYRYPIALLDDTKNLVFASDGSRIYR